jgi:hypothetical protein
MALLSTIPFFIVELNAAPATTPSWGGWLGCSRTGD